jgi:hypothetical protein
MKFDDKQLEYFEQFKKQAQISSAKNKLKAIAEDLQQIECGRTDKDKHSLIIAFKQAHNELRVLLGKEAVEYKD